MSLYIYLSALGVLSIPVIILYTTGPIGWISIYLVQHKRFPLRSPLMSRLVLPSILTYMYIPSWYARMTSYFFICILWFLYYTYVTSVSGVRILMTGDAFLPTIDGISTFNTNVIRSLYRRGYEVLVMTAVPGSPTLEGADVYRSNVGPKLHGYPDHWLACLTPGMVYRIWTYRPTIMHIWEISGILSVQMIILSALLGIPCVTSIHTLILPYARILFPYVPSWVIKFIYMIYSNTLLRIPKQNFTVYESTYIKEDVPLPTDMIYLPSGVDHVNYTKDRRSNVFRSMYSDDGNNKCFVLYVGRMSDDKNVLCLSSIFKEVYAQRPNTVFILVGDGNRREQLKYAMMNDNLPVFFLGSRTQEELSTIYASCDIFVSPSTSEAFGLVFVEAMSSGLLCVGMNHAAVPKLFPRDYMFLCNRVDEDLIPTIIRAVDMYHTPKGEELCKQLVQYSKRYTWENTVNVLLESYHW